MLEDLHGNFTTPAFGRHETESFLFHLHYPVTFFIVMTCGLVVMSNVMVGGSIICTDAPYFSHQVMESYLWTNFAQSVATDNGTKPDQNVSYLGNDTYDSNFDCIYRDFNSFIYVLLFCQGVFFYLPHSIWKSMENDKMQQISDNIANPPPAVSTLKFEYAWRKRKLELNGKLFNAAVWLHERLGQHSKYAFQYLFCEIMAWLNVILQTCTLNVFLQGEFIPLGSKAVNYFMSEPFSDNPLSCVFPRSVNCHFNKLLPSGKIETHHTLCLLPINALGEKICVLLWFWFAFLFSLGVLRILLAILTARSPKIRGFRFALQVKSLGSPISRESESLASTIGELTGYGDWFVFSVLAEKMDVSDFNQLLYHFCQLMVINIKSKLADYVNPRYKMLFPCDIHFQEDEQTTVKTIELLPQEN